MTDQTTRRNSLRLQGYDYRNPGYYFVTILAFQRQCLFGEVLEKKVHLNQLGEIVKHHWLSIPKKKLGFDIDAFVIMPNHLHGIVRIMNTVQKQIAEENMLAFAKANSLSVLIRTFKASVTKSARKEIDDYPPKIWHRSFNDRILRDSESLDAIRFYIKSNPWRWKKEKNIY